jgi:hypothetical protein
MGGSVPYLIARDKRSILALFQRIYSKALAAANFVAVVHQETT